MEEGSKGSQEKKTKKKKTSKSSDVKTKPNAEIKEDIVKEEVEGKSENNTLEEKSAENTHVSKPEEISEAVAVKSNMNESKDKKVEEKEIKQQDEKEQEKDKINSMDLEKLIELKEAFSLFDFNHDGIIDLQDLKYTFASLGKPDFPEEEMKKMLSEAKEPVDFDAFVTLFGYKVSMLDPEEVFTKALSSWDMRNVGLISEERLKRDIQSFGDKFTVKDSHYALEEAPVYVNQGVSMIDYVKFSNNICGFRNVQRTREFQKDLEEADARK